MAGGITEGIWAVVSKNEWVWFFGEPLSKAECLQYFPMLERPDRDEFECWTGTHRLVLTRKEIMLDNGDIAKRARPLPPTGPPEDKPFVGFDNLPEPEFGTGWDDFDWSK